MKRLLTRFFLLLPALLITLSTKAQLNTSETVITLPADGNDLHYKINEPNVRQRRTEYPSITFKPGDVVEFRAGGCVQTGGSGLTWKRYVMPSGPNSDRFYHGMVMIPGIMTSVDFLSNHLNGLDATSAWSRKFTIPKDAKFQEPFLVLGYTDDNYDDNGYWGHDNGTQQQCNGVGNAWFEIYIHRK
ncbi:MAG: hypothetical protein U0Y10_00555 [Spirosomataceae bacterium]